MPAGIVFIALFIAVFGIAYLYFSTRNKERLALIEKGADASIFMQTKKKRGVPGWKYAVLTGALVMIFIGIAFFVGNFLQLNMAIEEEIAIPGSVFFFGGIGLGLGLLLSSKLEASHRISETHNREF